MSRHWIDEIGDRLGLPIPVFASGRLRPGARVEIVLEWTPDERIASAVIVRKEGEVYLVRYSTREGRRRIAKMPFDKIIADRKPLNRKGSK